MITGPERLMRWLALAGSTQSDFAKELGRNRSFISQLKSGAKRPTLDMAVRIEHLTGIPAASWAATSRAIRRTPRKSQDRNARVA